MEEQIAVMLFLIVLVTILLIIAGLSLKGILLINGVILLAYGFGFVSGSE